VFGNDTETIYQAHATEVTGHVHLAEPIFADHFAFLASAVTTAVPKLTIPSPSMVHFRADLSASGYAGKDEFRADLAAAYAGEITALAALGCTYLQLDDTSLAYLNDPAQRAVITARGEDATNLHLRYIAQVNAALAGRPAALAVTTHLCRGNYRSSWAATGGYDYVAEALFSELDVDGFFLEYDDHRSGGFAPLRYIPPGKTAVLGLVTTKTGQLEDPDQLKRRIDDATRYVPLDQLALSGQCGFSSTADGNTLTHDQQRAKLDLIVTVAHDIWG
jgi:5-methyltetrahydropteroyltriglutamate--homocysteine methyltransferase